MVELFADEPLAKARQFYKAYGGDTLNLLVAAARLGSSVGYITRVGDDPFASYLLESWQAEGVDTSQVKVVPGFSGLYFISLLAGGEREFTYYRQGSAASTLSLEDVSASYVGQAKVMHASGITQALSPTCRAAVLAAFKLAKEQGVAVSYDPNLRLRLWSLKEAQAAFEEVLPYLDVVLASAPEETGALFGLEEPEAVVQYLFERGVRIAAVKAGARGCVVGQEGQIQALAAIAPRGVVDSTGAGDAFNGAFLHGLVRGLDVEAAARLGVVTSGLKLGGRGAIESLPNGQDVAACVSLYDQQMLS